MRSSTEAVLSLAIRRGPARRLLSLIVLVSASGLAFAAPPSFSGPSQGRVAQPVTFAGAGFAPNAPVTVFVKRPGGGEAGFGAVVTPQGTLRYSYVPDSVGLHALKVTDSAGRPLAQAVLTARP
jgi:hypothetical protein